MHISFTIYPHHMMQELLAVGSEAEVLWYVRAESFKMFKKPETLGEKIKDMGFYVWYIPKNKRKPQKLFICSAYGAKNGSLPYEVSIEEIKRFFKTKEIDVLYQGGFSCET